MLAKIQNKLLKIRYIIDVMELAGDVVTVKGWIFSEKKDIEKIQIIFRAGREECTEDIIYGIEREDVFEVTGQEHSRKSGFEGEYLLYSSKKVKVLLCYYIQGNSYELYLGELRDNLDAENSVPIRVEPFDPLKQGIGIADIVKGCEQYKYEFPERLYTECIDVIIPVYNGYQFLDKLLQSVALTRMKYRLFLINDKSTDSRVLPFLQAYAEGKEHVVLLENDVNMGFVQTVNRGFELSSHHVALVNTDVELPEMWLERLMLPILTDSRVASSTPFTNCGTICSFPEFLKDNKLFMDLDVSEIDKEFMKIQPVYQKIPTGVGFCMGVSRKALKEVGIFDAETFGKGYGEENDWCQRAIRKGYKNVHVENLFVYHKHGGSFLSEDKKRYLREHEKRLLKKHPYYNKDVARFCEWDPNKHIREYVKMNLLQKNRELDAVVAFDHSFGGGASKYLEERKNRYIDKGKAFIIIRYDLKDGIYRFLYYFQDIKIQFYVENNEDLFRMIECIPVRAIWLNEIVTYPEFYELLRGIRECAVKRGICIRMLVHDFFAVCPTINLIDWKEEYCGIPDCGICSECLGKMEEIQPSDYGSIEKWRQEWYKLLEICTEIIVFSNNSKNIMEKAYGSLNNIIVQPHSTAYLPKVEKKYKTTDTLNIGLLGVLAKHKGRAIVEKLAARIEEEQLKIRIVLIGSSEKEINSSVFRETGAYTRESIPKLVLENDIDVFLLSSICPETFSYTAEEIMKMGMPVMCFDIGAPAERIGRYGKGIVLPDMQIQTILDTLEGHPIVTNTQKLENRQKKVLFVTGELSEPRENRIQNFREQLFYVGAASDVIAIQEAGDWNLEQYTSIIVCSIINYKLIQEFVEGAHACGKTVFYDIGDYAEYKQDPGAYKSARACDAYIVAAEDLKLDVKTEFPDKEVFVKRNVASLEMVAISKGINHEIHKDKVVLGYFCSAAGSSFCEIGDVLLDIMERNQNVHLWIGGQFELPPEFTPIYGRIERVSVADVREALSLLARTDINLEPVGNADSCGCGQENKWLEAALACVPTVSSWNAGYKDFIENGVDGCLCGTKEEWKDMLQKLIDDEELRSQIAGKAYEKAMEQYTTLYMEKEILDALVNRPQYAADKNICRD